jgi:hypothetical protein
MFDHSPVVGPYLRLLIAELGKNLQDDRRE